MHATVLFERQGERRLQGKPYLPATSHSSYKISRADGTLSTLTPTLRDGVGTQEIKLVPGALQVDGLGTRVTLETGLVAPAFITLAPAFASAMPADISILYSNCLLLQHPTLRIS